MHERYDPGAVVDFLDSHTLPASVYEMLIFLRCTQMRPQLVTRASRSCSG
jgi:hypothetical protein